MRVITRVFSILVVSLITAIACGNPTPENGKGGDIEIAEAEKLIESEEVVVLDVRTPDEYNSGHLKDAVHIDYYEDNFKQEIEKLPKEKTYVVYCHSGGRSSKTMRMMSEMGFEEVYNLDGGISDWKSEGGETVQ